MTKKSLLLSIDSKLTQLELQENIFEYDVFIDEGVTELDLNPVVSEGSKVEITSQKIAELQNGKIIIMVSNNDIKEEYIVNVKIGRKKDRTTIIIDDSVFAGDNGYKKKWIFAFCGFGTVLILSLILMKKK